MPTPKRLKRGPLEKPTQLRLGFTWSDQPGGKVKPSLPSAQPRRRAAMIQIRPGDLLALQSGDRYYYAVVLTKIIMFGGNLVHAFHLVTDEVMSFGDVLSENTSGFNAIVDFIDAKRDGRITRLGEVEDYNRFRVSRYYRSARGVPYQYTSEVPHKAQRWWIYDEELRQVKQVSQLSDIERRYTDHGCINEPLLVSLINSCWSPERDPRI